jgi:ACS family glucarate transporter-like MFS transporter
LTSDSTRYPKYRWLILIAAALSYANAQIINLSIAPDLHLIAQDLGIELGLATQLMSAFLFSGCILMFTLGGAVGDRFGILPTLLIGLLMAVVPAALMPWIGHSFKSVFWARLIQGLSPGFIFPIMGPILALWFPLKQKGLATSITSAAVAAGSAAGTLGGAAILENLVGSWQEMAAWVSVIGWIDVVFVIFLLVLPKPHPPAQKKPVADQPNWKEYAVALIAPLTLVAILVNFFASWNMHCLYSVTPTFLSAPEGAGYGGVLSGQLMINVTIISGIFGPILCGLFVDRLFKGDTKQVFTIGFIVMCIFMFLIKTPSVYQNKTLLSISLVMAGFGVQFVMPAVYIWIAKSYGHKILAKMTGLVMGIGTLGGVFGIYMSGVTLGWTGSYSIPYTLITFAAIVGLVFTIILHRMKPLVTE